MRSPTTMDTKRQYANSTVPFNYYENGVFAIIREGPSEGGLISLGPKLHAAT